MYFGLYMSFSYELHCEWVSEMSYFEISSIFHPNLNFYFILLLLACRSTIPIFQDFSTTSLLDLDNAGMSSTSSNEMSFSIFYFHFSNFYPHLNWFGSKPSNDDGHWIDWKLGAWLTTKLTTPVTFQIWVDLSFDLLHATQHTITFEVGTYIMPLFLFMANWGRFIW